MTEVFDTRHCHLGEGPFWHPRRGQLFWFDIIGKRLLSRTDAGPLEWDMGQHASAAGWIDDDTLLVATETGLSRFDIATGQRSQFTALEADRPDTRSNDGRADPFGGFWIGTMGKSAEPRAGAIYRFFRGEVIKMFDGITIPNAICFRPDGRCAYFADTVARTVWRVALDEQGWPEADPQVFLDQTADGLNPDGAVVDAEGALWVAQWGAGRVTRFLSSGQPDRSVEIPGKHSSCPCFGGDELDRMYVTTAREDLATPTEMDGRTFVLSPGVSGLPAPQVIL